MKLTKEEFTGKLHHSAVSQECTWDDVAKVCQETIDYGFHTAYVLPLFVKAAREKFGPKLPLGTAISLPMGTAKTSIKILETEQAIDDGADSIDIVICVPRLLAGDYEYCSNELKAIVKAARAKKPDVILKVIVECNLLNYTQKVEAIKLVRDSGVDVIKSNTGSSGFGARVSDIRLMKEIAGDKIIVKAAGDSEDAGAAMELFLAGADHIGNSAEACWDMVNTFDDYYPHYENL